ncbi:MAG TPA: AAA family ATPase [Thermoleophilaceae bacterium]
MLLGRSSERQTLDRLLADSRLGRSGVLALVGEPGIGKTALLEYAGGRADGMRVLRARGVESEAEVPFAGLHELLRPALGAVEQIPAPQAEALGGALALRPGRAGDRFAVGAATLSLLAAYAEHRPLLLLIDDAQSLDASSAGALLFAFRRLLADPIAVLIAARSGEPSALLDGSDLPRLELGGLDREAAGELAAQASAEALPPEAAARLYEETGGNPLALLELAADSSLLGEAPPEGPLPLSASIAHAFLRRSSSLPEETRRLLVLAAASDDRHDLATLGRAAAALDLSVDSLAAAEDAGLVSVGAGLLEFRHPLVRSAIYGEAEARERRAAHRALAGALPDQELDRRAWHLAAAALGPDAAASSALELAGIRARERSAYGVSAAAFERSARLADEPGRRPALLYAAADAALNAGLGDRAMACVDEALAAQPDDPLAYRLEYLRGYLISRRGEVMEGHTVLIAAAERAARRDPEFATMVLAEAAHVCFYSGAAEAMLRTARRAEALVPRGDRGRARFFASTAMGTAQVVAGDGEAGAQALRQAAEVLDASEELREDPRLLAWAALGPLWLREGESGGARVERTLDYARERSAAGVLPGLLHYIGRVQAMSDSWPGAQASYDESIQLARESGQRTELAAALAGLAWLEARQGAEERCRAHAAESRMLCTELGVALYEVWTVIALGELELGLGRPDAAIGHFEEQRRLLEQLRIVDVDLSPVPELVDAYLRVGRQDDAAALVGPFAAAVEAKGQPWALARAARCLGLVGADAELDERFGEALALHERTPDVFEAARTRLAYGARLRRARKRVRAREELRAAIELFDSLGPTSWTELAGAELAATGETARRRDPSTLDDLTPQELQIAVLLSEGRTTRQTAAALFLSPKTIEYHLRNVYRKLGISSREELAAAISSRPKLSALT